MARVTIDLPRMTEVRLRELARANGQDLPQFLLQLAERAADIPLPDEAASEFAEAAVADADPFTALIERVRLTSERIAERQAQAVANLRPLAPPTDGTNGMHRAFGHWPGKESEEDLLALEQVLDDEDAGRPHGGS